MFLIELAKGRRGELQVLPPLITRGDGGDYSAEVSRMLTGE
jgi:tRNA1Val (adenine37-N6)-methyltransferase